MRNEDQDSAQLSFPEEQGADDRVDFRRQVLRWSLGFALLFFGVFFAFWWSGSALRYGASRVTQSTAPSYKVWGIVHDARSNQAVPWAEIADEPSGRSPMSHATADRNGAYELVTLAEPHRIRVTANGYKPSSITVGKQWFLWMPSGSERLDVELEPQ